MGKTALSIGIAQNAALQPQHHGKKATVGIFSLEMSKEQLVQRLLCSQARVDAHRLRNGMLNKDDWRRLAMAVGELSEAEIYLDDTPGISVLEIRAKARRLKNEQKGLDLLIVDYLQLIRGRGRHESRQQEVSQISRELKMLAKELNIPLIALSQLSRAPEARTGNKPQLSDLRESGCLTGDSMVTLDAHTHARIDSLMNRKNFQVLALNPETWRIDRRMVTNAFPSGEKPVFKLVTRSGKSIKATSNHRFLTPNGWCRLNELKVGDKLAVPTQSIQVTASSNSIEQQIEAINNVYWDKIATITPKGKEQVYDITVEGVHNFIANGFIVHNSLEQDADVVMFIYREEVYNPATDKQGIAEIIIGKQRNGPIGTTELVFLKQLTRFEDKYHE